MAQQSAEKKQSHDKVSVKNSSKKLRDKRLNIRFSGEEFSMLEAKAEGISLARYARAILTKGKVTRRERDFPTIDPRLLQQLHAMGKNLNQLVRYTHEQANAKRPIDTLNLALAIDNMAEQLARLKAQYQVPENYFRAVEDEDVATEANDSATDNPIESSPINNGNLNNHVIG